MYFSEYHLLILCLLFTLSRTSDLGSVNILINGKTQTKYAIASESVRGNVVVTPTSITLSGGGHAYFGNSSSNTLSPNSYFLMPLLGNTFTFTVDMSQVGCSCNGALYAVSMPAYNSAQQLVPGNNGEYYCDANKVGGTFCPEMYIMEANKYAMASTAHTCQYVPPHYYPSCDRGGCGKNVLDADYNGYGPGKTIDTNKPFTLSVSFVTDSAGTLSSINNHFFQEGRSIQFTSCNPDYLQWMGKSLPGITVTMSLWGTEAGGMSWLDGKSGCHGGCNLRESKVTFSDFKLDQQSSKQLYNL